MASWLHAFLNSWLRSNARTKSPFAFPRAGVHPLKNRRSEFEHGANRCHCPGIEAEDPGRGVPGYTRHWERGRGETRGRREEEVQFPLGRAARILPAVLVLGLHRGVPEEDRDGALQLHQTPLASRRFDLTSSSAENSAVHPFTVPPRL